MDVGFGLHRWDGYSWHSGSVDCQDSLGSEWLCQLVKYIIWTVGWFAQPQSWCPVQLPLCKWLMVPMISLVSIQVPWTLGRVFIATIMVVIHVACNNLYIGNKIHSQYTLQIHLYIYVHTLFALKSHTSNPTHIFEMISHLHGIRPTKPVIRVPAWMATDTPTNLVPLMHHSIVKFALPSLPLHSTAAVWCWCGQLIFISDSLQIRNIPLHHTLCTFISNFISQKPWCSLSWQHHHTHPYRNNSIHRPVYSLHHKNLMPWPLHAPICVFKNVYHPHGIRLMKPVFRVSVLTCIVTPDSQTNVSPLYEHHWTP